MELVGCSQEMEGAVSAGDFFSYAVAANHDEHWFTKTECEGLPHEALALPAANRIMTSARALRPL